MTRLNKICFAYIMPVSMIIYKHVLNVSNRLECDENGNKKIDIKLIEILTNFPNDLICVVNNLKKFLFFVFAFLSLEFR